MKSSIQQMYLQQLATRVSEVDDKNVEASCRKVMMGVPHRLQAAVHHSVDTTGLSLRHTLGQAASHSPRSIHLERAASYKSGNCDSHIPITSRDSRANGGTTPTSEQLSSAVNGEKWRSTSLKREASKPTHKEQGTLTTITTVTTACAITTTTKLSFITTTTSPRTSGSTVSPACTTTLLDCINGYGGTLTISQTQEMKSPHQRQAQEEERKIGPSPASSQLFPDVVLDAPEPQFLPEKIVLLIDRQDAYLRSFYYPNVLHIYDAKLNFGNAFDMIKKTNYVFKNTLFVMLCGTMSALRQDINEKCLLFQCKEPLYNFSLQEFKAPSLSEFLISEAKNLRKNITEMNNCDVIFSGVLPVRTDCAETYEAAKHYSQTGHQVKLAGSRYEFMYSKLCSGLREFNRWAKEDAALRGFPQWSLVDMFITTHVEDISQHFTHPTQADGVTLTGECMVQRRIALKTKLKETFQRVKKTSQGPKPKEAVMVPELGSRDPEAYSLPNETLAEHVVLLADQMHRKNLVTLTSKGRVSLITEKKLVPDNIDKLVQKYYSRVSCKKKITWILCFGIHNFVDTKVNDLCLINQCGKHFIDISDNITAGNINQKIQNAMSTLKKFKSNLKKALPEKTVVLVAPLMHTAVMQADPFKSHSELHIIATKQQLYLCRAASYGITRHFYWQLFKKWLHDAIEPEGGICEKRMRNYITKYQDKCLRMLDANSPHMKYFCSGWINMMSKVIAAHLKHTPVVTGLSGTQLSVYLSKLPSIIVVEPSQSTGKTLTFNLQNKPDKHDPLFRHMVVVGNQLPAELEELCLRLSIHVVPKRVTYDEAGKALIRKYEKFWPHSTLWVILTDVLHLATSEVFLPCREEKCKDPIPIFSLGVPTFTRKCKLNSSNKLEVENFISRVEKFSESLIDELGEGSGVFLPPVTPVFLMRPHLSEDHKILHDNYNSYGKIAMVNGKSLSWKKTHLFLKKAWLDMLKPYLENYSVPKKILQLYSSSDPKQDWIRTLGKLLVYFASASIDEGDAVFSDTDLSSGEEDTEIIAASETTESASPHPFHQGIGTLSAQTEATTQQGMQHELRRTPRQQQHNKRAMVTTAAQIQWYDVSEKEQQPLRTERDLITPMTERRQEVANKGQDSRRKKRGRETLTTEKDQKHPRTEKRQKTDETERGLLLPRKKRSKETARAKEGQEPPRTGKGQEHTKPEKGQESCGKKIEEESAKIKKGLETPNQGKGQEVPRQEKSQIIAKTEKGQDTLKQGKSQESPKQGKYQEPPKQGRGQKTSKKGKGQETPKQGRGQETSKQGKIQNITKTEKGQETSSQEKCLETSKQGKDQKDSKQDRSQKTPKQGRDQETFKEGKTQIITKTEKGQESLRQGKTRESFKQEKDQETIQQENRQVVRKTEKGQEFPIQRKGQKIPVLRKGQGCLSKGQEPLVQGQGHETSMQSKGHVFTKTERGQETLLQGKNLEIPKEVSNHITKKREKGQKISVTGDSQGTPMEGNQETSKHGKREVSGKIEKGQEIAMQGKGQVTIKMKKEEGIPWPEEGQQPQVTEKSQVIVKMEESQYIKAEKFQDIVKSEEFEDIAETEEFLWSHRKVEGGCDDEEASNADSDTWIILSQTSEDEDFSESKPPVDQDGLQEGDHLNNQLQNITTTSGNPTYEQSQICKAENPLPELGNNNTALTRAPVSSEAQSVNCKDDASDGVAKSVLIEDMDVSGSIQNMEERGPKQDIDESGPREDINESSPERDTDKNGLKKDIGEGDPKQDMKESCPKKDMGRSDSKQDTNEGGPKRDMDKNGSVMDKGESNPKQDMKENCPTMDMVESSPKPDGEESGPEWDMDVAGLKDEDENSPNQNDESVNTEIISNPDSIETIPLDDFEQDQIIFSASEDCDFFDYEPESNAHEENSEVQFPREVGVGTATVGTKPHGDPEGGRSSFSRKRRHSSPDRDSTTLFCSSDSSCFDSDPETKKLFLMVEESLNQSYQLRLQTFMQVPEAHVDFEAKRAEFLESHGKEHGERVHDEDQCGRAWRVFWEDTVGKQLHEEWQKSKKELVDQFKVISRTSSCISSSKVDQPKRMKIDKSGGKENHIFQNCSTNPQQSETSPLMQNTSPKEKSKCSSNFESGMTDTTQCKQLTSSVDRPATNSELKQQTSSLNMDKIMINNTKRRVRLILSSFALLSELGQSLGTLAPAVVPIIKSVLDEGVHSQEALHILAKKENVDVMKKCTERFRHLSEKTKGPYKEKLVKCSTDTTELLENVSTSMMIIRAMQSLDIPSIARATASQDMTYILEFIKDVLARKGMHNPSKSILNELFLAVSSHQFNMAVYSPVTVSPDPSK